MPRTINDILPPSRRRGMTPEGTSPEPLHAPTPITSQIPNSTPLDTPRPSSMPPMQTPPPRVRIRTGGGFPYGTALIALIVVAISAGVLYAFSGAKVSITPASQVATVGANFTATNGAGDLPFTVITVTKTATASVPAESTLTANDSAQGTIIISNAQKTAQTLINNTRFATPTGLVFRIHSPILIPPATASGPGTVSVPVFADQPGVNYNVEPTTFTVPGLQNSSSYTLVTARSTAAMTGGFSGTRASVSQSTDDAQHATLQKALSTSLQSALAAQIPTGDVLLPGASFTAYQTQPDSATTTTSVLVSVQGTVNAVVFPESALAKAIASNVGGTYSGQPVTLNGVTGLSFTPAPSPIDFSALNNPSSTLSFGLSGQTKVVWTVDPVRIAGAVAGKTRDSAQLILQGFPEVDRAVLTLRPFWASTFPQDPTHIKVVVTPPAGS